MLQVCPAFTVTKACVQLAFSKHCFKSYNEAAAVAMSALNLDFSLTNDFCGNQEHLFSFLCLILVH